MLTSIFVVGLGGALGSILRYVLSVALASPDPAAFPLATFVVNFVGSVLIGFVTQLLTPQGNPLALNFWTKGFCGGFTTFSTFSLETWRLLENKHYGMAGVNVGVSLVVCLAGVAVGLALGSYVKRALA